MDALQEIRQRWIDANEAYCSEIGAPCFAPVKGICYECRRDIVIYYGEKYMTTFITGCPYCHISYCE